MQCFPSKKSVKKDISKIILYFSVPMSDKRDRMDTDYITYLGELQF